MDQDIEMGLVEIRMNTMADALDILSIEIASLECAIEKRKLTLFFFSSVRKWP